MSITEQIAINRMVEEDQQIYRDVANAISTLNREADKMINMGAYLATNVSDPASPVDAEHMARVVARFQEQYALLLAVVTKFADIDGIADADPTIAATNLSALITKYTCDTSTYLDRFKV